MTSIHRFHCGLFFYLHAADLMSVSKAVSGIELTQHLVEFIITLFDEDGKS